MIVTGEDDPIVDGPQVYTIETGDVTSGDNDYDNLVGTDVADISMTNTDDDTANLSVLDVTVDEDVVGGTMVFDVVLDNGVLGGTTVDFTFFGCYCYWGWCRLSRHRWYTYLLGTANEIQKITATIINDALMESSEETFTVELGAPSNAGVNIAGSGIITGTIIDDDNCAPPPVLNPGIPILFCGTINISLNDYTSSLPPSGMEPRWSINSNPLDDSRAFVRC